MKKSNNLKANSQQPNGNLSIAELIKDTARIFTAMIDAAGRIIKRLKGGPSCLAPMKCKPAIYPLSYDKNAAQSMKGTPVFNGVFINWRLQIRVELYVTRTLIFIDNEIEAEQLRACILQLKQA